ncbi:MAG: hypothetical protein ACFFAJ_03865 [Candidatus Hodarchaeota archaeon]
MVNLKRRRRHKKINNRLEAQMIAEDTMHFLLEESLQTRIDDPLQSIRLFSAARKIGKRNRLHISQQFRFLFCRSCYHPLSATSARIRLNSKKHQIHYQCLKCNHEQRFGYRKKKQV